MSSKTIVAIIDLLIVISNKIVKNWNSLYRKETQS